MTITGGASGGGISLPINESDVQNLVSDLAGKAAASHTHAQADVTGLVAALAAKEATANKGAASGYAPLDAGSKLPLANLPSHTHAESDITNLVSDLAAKEATANKGAASGYAGLDAGTKVPTAQLGGAGASASKVLRGDQSWALAGLLSGLVSMPDDITPTGLTADQDDYAPTGLSTASVIRLSGDSSFRSITGITGGSDGRLLVLTNVGTYSILLRCGRTSTASTAANRFDFGGYDQVLSPQQFLVLYYDSTDSRWKSMQPNVAPRGNSSFYYFNDFMQTQADEVGSSNGSGTAASTAVGTSDLAAPGVITHSTGSTNTGRHGWGTAGNNANAFFLGNSWYWRYTSKIRIATLSNGTDTFTTREGFQDNGGGDSIDGVYFRQTDGVNSGNWQLVARKNSAETVVNTSIAPSANTWTTLTVIVMPDGTAFGIIDGTITSSIAAANVPTAAGRLTGIFGGIIKTVGTTARTEDRDFQEVIAYANQGR